MMARHRAGCGSDNLGRRTEHRNRQDEFPMATEQIQIPDGQFLMGSNRHYSDERPERRVSVAGFSMDSHPVTNTQFAAFVNDTQHVTVAEIAPEPSMYPEALPEDLVAGSLVFTMSEGPVALGDFRNWWRWIHGANWRHPSGPESNIDELSDHPVVHVAHADAAAYADWVDGRLPTEAEWEFAARGGLDGAEFCWGDEDTQETQPRANTWQGGFPFENTELDGWTYTSPVASYEPNGFGLHDMAGNVWEWTNDWYRDTSQDIAEPSCCGPDRATAAGSIDKTQPLTPIPRKVLKGGSHLCTPQYCLRYRPAARQAQMIDTSTSHLGFRCVERTI